MKLVNVQVITNVLGRIFASNIVTRDVVRMPIVRVENCVLIMTMTRLLIKGEISVQF